MVKLYRFINIFLSTAFLLTLAAMPVLAHAETTAQVKAVTRPTMVVIVDINCPFCRALLSQGASLKQSVNAAGLNYIYAPIPANGDTTTAWPARLFYASRSMPGNQSTKILNAMMEAQDYNGLHTSSQTIVWLQTKLPKTHWVNYMKSRVKTDKTKQAADRAMRLAATIHLSQFPTFAIVGLGDRAPFQIAAGHDTPLPDRLKSISDWLQRYKMGQFSTTEDAKP